ncbi:hypothetical protein LVJ94_43445 [Pendulispora rubella]|uniref:Cytochrome c domain-containing protein n=1 Tax=Pendulispora rubella TaxID=2741070 RepID=A0ABZ2LKB6_9BACT
MTTGIIAACHDGGDDGGTSTSVAAVGSPEEFFAARVQPNLGYCRTCHVPGGVADKPEGRRMMLSPVTVDDYRNLQTSWTNLGKGVDSNLILQNASGQHAHSGGAPWATTSAAYQDMKMLLACWDDPAHCDFGGEPPPPPPTYPLLGNLASNGGRNYAAQFCENKPDSEPLPLDPRELISGSRIGNPNYAVFYNAPYKVCANDTLLENQAKQNALLVAQGKAPIYSAKPRPATCGEWRAAVERGRTYIFSNPITGDLITVDGVWNMITSLGYTIPTDPQAATALLSKVMHARYGYPPSPYPNPFPMPGEDPNRTNGGSVQGPLGFVQTKDANGRWTGVVGATCYGCHLGQMGNGEVSGDASNYFRNHGHPEITGSLPMGFYAGAPGTNIDLGLLYYDANRANGVYGRNSIQVVLDNPGYMANRSRGVNAADQEIVNVLLFRELGTLDWRAKIAEPAYLGKLMPTVPLTGGDQQTPAWWWTHNKTRYLWTGFGSAGSSRGNYFPSSTNKYDGYWSKRREGDFQDLDIWLNTVEAPKYPHGHCSNADGSPGPADSPYCIDRPLAEQGAILFHSKNLWADGANADIERPAGGNGSCAGCHGVYSPYFAHQPGYLPDPRLVGYAGYVAPQAVVGTDSADSDLFNGLGARPLIPQDQVASVASMLWMFYPDALPGFIPPEKLSPLQNQLMGVVNSGEPVRPANDGCSPLPIIGYTAQPLHGVWAAAPYLHNGSVPSLWDVLKPSDRPDVWRRQLAPASQANPKGEVGFDTSLSAYDFDKMGWKYSPLQCSDVTGPGYLSCRLGPYTKVPTVFDLATDAFKSFADYFPPAPDAVAQRAVFNTHGYGKGNQGHAYTKVLTDPERKALLEYLKTL